MLLPFHRFPVLSLSLLTPARDPIPLVGDTRCVLSRAGKAVALSNDHRLATRPDERQRVEQAGALVRADRVRRTRLLSLQ